jgi:hypothetical protein
MQRGEVQKNCRFSFHARWQCGYDGRGIDCRTRSRLGSESHPPLSLPLPLPPSSEPIPPNHLNVFFLQCSCIRSIQTTVSCVFKVSFEEAMMLLKRDIRYDERQFPREYRMRCLYEERIKQLKGVCIVMKSVHFLFHSDR